MSYADINFNNISSGKGLLPDGTKPFEQYWLATNVLGGIHPGPISQELFINYRSVKKEIHDIFSEITLLELLPHPPGANELIPWDAVILGYKRVIITLKWRMNLLIRLCCIFNTIVADVLLCIESGHQSPTIVMTRFSRHSGLNTRRVIRHPSVPKSSLSTIKRTEHALPSKYP